MKYFPRSFSHADSKKAVVSFWRTNVHKYWLKRTKPAQEKWGIWLTDWLDMTLIMLTGPSSLYFH